ncbi:MAG: proteasome assembly chaperone family protein [Candidatus Methanofastidiosia archaeon]
MIDIVLKEEIKFKDPIVIEGFPGVGLVGHIAATYLVSELKIPQIGFIRTDLLPQVSMVFNGKVVPPARIYGNEKLIVFISDLAFPDIKTYPMAMALGDFMKKHNVSKSISLAGIGTSAPTGKIFGVGSSEDILLNLSKIGIEILPMGSISGGSGALLLECHHKDIPSIALLAETYGNRPDPRSASGLLNIIGKLINKKIDTKMLIKEAEQLESALSKLSKDVENQTKRDEFDAMYM